MRKTRTKLVISTLGLLICAQAGLGADPNPQDAADQLTGGAAGPASGNPQCALFTAEEIAGYLGEPVAAGVNAGMGMGCQWIAIDDDGDAMVTVVPSDYAERPTLAPGFKEVATIAPDAFVVPELGGWAAGATTGDSFVKVAVAGAAADAGSALALLAETIRRRGD